MRWQTSSPRAMVLGLSLIHISFYYVPMNGMDEDLLPTAAGGAFAESSKAAPGIDPVAATVGVVAVAAVGVGVGVGVKKSKDKAKAQAKTEAKSE